MAEHNNPSGLGYPWVDRASGSVILSVVNASGQTTIDEWLQAGAQAAGPKAASFNKPEVAVRQRTVAFSYAKLAGIMDDATRLAAAGVTDAGAIWATGPDFENNRIIITVDRQSEALFAALATRYGTAAIAVRVDAGRPRVQDLSRRADSYPFWGGATLNTPTGSQCTSGFSWTDATYDYMFTAGHCGPIGGTYSTPTQTMGSVTASIYENWNTSVGTQYLTYNLNDTTYRGDVSLIQVTSPATAAARIYRGGYDSSTYASVKEMWWGAPTAGDQFCTGGAANSTGEICGYTVSYVSGAIRGNVDMGNGVWKRGVTKASNGAGGACQYGGDSGAPVYTVRGDGGIAAKGILDAMDFFDCHTIWFTDMDLAYYGVPGYLKVE